MQKKTSCQSHLIKKKTHKKNHGGRGRRPSPHSHPPVASQIRLLTFLTWHFQQLLCGHTNMSSSLIPNLLKLMGLYWRDGLCVDCATSLIGDIGRWQAVCQLHICARWNWYRNYWLSRNCFSSQEANWKMDQLYPRNAVKTLRLFHELLLLTSRKKSHFSSEIVWRDCLRSSRACGLFCFDNVSFPLLFEECMIFLQFAFKRQL